MGEQDEMTATLLAVKIKQHRLMLAGMMLCAGFLAVLTTDWRFGLVLVLCYLVLCEVIWFRHGLPPGWARAARQLLATQPWRETPAIVLNMPGTVLALPGGEHIRVHGLPAEACEVVIRAQRVWLVGPDAAGRLAVRVDGLHTPLPARRVRPRQVPPAGPNGQTIATMWMRNQLRAARVGLVGGAMSLASGTLVVFAEGWASWSYLFVASVLLNVGVASWAFRRIARLRHTEQSWVRAEAVEPVWQARALGLASGTVTLAFPDGHWFTAHLDRAPLDLFANVAREKALWVADKGVVGFPYYPVLARASLTPVTHPVAVT